MLVEFDPLPRSILASVLAREPTIEVLEPLALPRALDALLEWVGEAEPDVVILKVSPPKLLERLQRLLDLRAILVMDDGDAIQCREFESRTETLRKVRLQELVRRIGRGGRTGPQGAEER